MKKEKCFFFLYKLRSLRHDQEKKKFFFNQLLRSLHHDQERKKVFFIQPLCPLMKKEKCCFSFIYYDHYAITNSESSFFIQLLRSLRYDQERKKFFFHLPTTITAPERNVFFIQPLCPLMKKEKCSFSFIHYDHYAMTKSESFFSLSYWDH